MATNRLVVIVGETASGKSDVAMRLAQACDGEIVCADSRTVYRGLDIATAKPSKADQAMVRHWGLDLVDPDEPFTVYDFQAAAKAAITDIQSRSKLPILVGGSGLYIEAVIYDFDFAQTNPMKRKALEALSLLELAEKAEQQFQDQELTSDLLGNRRQLIRALEANQLPRSIAERQLQPGTTMVGLSLPSEVIAQRIRDRVGLMMEHGLVDEAERVLADTSDNPALTSIAYRAFRNYVDGQETLEEAKEAFIQGDIKLAKKQRTWFRRDSNIKWFDNPTDCLEYLERVTKSAS